MSNGRLERTAARPGGVQGGRPHGGGRRARHRSFDRVSPSERAGKEAWRAPVRTPSRGIVSGDPGRSEEHTSELQSLMRISYAVFCLKKKRHQIIYQNTRK